MARVFPMILAPVDDFFRIDDHPGYPMTFVTQLKVAGTIDRPAFERALSTALQRHPILSALIGIAKRGQLCWIEAKNATPRLDWADRSIPMQCPDGGHIDLSREVGLRVWVRQGDDEADLVFQYHHAATDGNGAHRFLGDLFAAYHAEHSGESPEFDPINPQELRNRRKRMGDVAINGTALALIKLGIEQGWDLFGRRICPLSTPRRPSEPSLPFPANLTTTLSRQEHKQLTATAKSSGVLLNDLLIAQLIMTVIDWNQRHQSSARGLIRILIPSDLRDKHDFEMPAANMTSFAYVSRRADQCGDANALLRGVKREVLQIRQHRHAARFMDAVMLLQRIPWSLKLLARWRCCLSTAVLSNVGDPTRRFRARLPRERGEIMFGNLRLKSWAGVSPLRPRTRAAITVNTYNRKLAVTVNCDPAYFGETDTQQFLNAFIARLRNSLTETAPIDLEQPHVLS